MGLEFHTFQNDLHLNLPITISKHNIENLGFIFLFLEEIFFGEYTLQLVFSVSLLEELFSNGYKYEMFAY